jgi:hypothetical protein
MFGDIRWLDGGSADGMFVMEIGFKDGTGYIKRPSFTQINNDLELFWRVSPEISSLTIYDPSRKVVASRFRASVSEAC